MERTDFAGLTRLDPGEALSTDGYSFQNLNPVIIDQLLRLAVQAHKHDGHAAMLDPTIDPVVAILDAGGTIPSETTIYVGYTLIDPDGGETTLNSSPGLVSTQDGLTTPDDAPTLESDTAAGTLVAATYAYAITVTDGAGGESALGPASSIVIDPGSATNQVILTGLTDLLSSTGGAAWRLWRQVNGGRWNLVYPDGTGDTVTDDGSLCPDCNVTPPTSGSGTTNNTNRLQVTVPVGQPDEAVSFRIYASTDGTFSNPALLGEYPVADLGVLKTYTTLTLLDGSPPLVSRTFPGANKVNALTDIINLKWKDAVATAPALPALGNTAGDIRLVLSDMSLHGWNGGAWVAVGGGGGGGGGDPTYELGTHIRWQDTGVDVVELFGSDQEVFTDFFAADDSSEYTFSNTLAGSAEGAGMVVIAGGNLHTAGSGIYFKYFGPTGMKGDFELVIQYAQGADPDRVAVYVGPQALSGVSYVLLALEPSSPTIDAQTSHAGTLEINSSDDWFFPPATGDTAWMRVTRVGADFTIEDWRTDPALGGAPDHSKAITVSAGVNTDTAASPVFLRIGPGAGVVGGQAYDNLKAVWKLKRALRAKVTKADGTSVTKVILDEDGATEV